MIQSCGESYLLKESLRAEYRGDFRVKDFQRDGAIMPRILRAVHDGHATSANFILDLIAAADER